MQCSINRYMKSVIHYLYLTGWLEIDWPLAVHLRHRGVPLTVVTRTLTFNELQIILLNTHSIMPQENA